MYHESARPFTIDTTTLDPISLLSSTMRMSSRDFMPLNPMY